MTSARFLKSTGRFQAKKLRAQRNRPGIGDLRKDCSRRMAGGFGLKAKTEKAQQVSFPASRHLEFWAALMSVMLTNDGSADTELHGL